MKRRQHWDTDLEQSVSEILFDCYNNGVSEEQVYQAIAAVEDWARWEHVPKGTLRRLEQAEAAIQRVRELHRVHRCRMSTQHTDCFITYGGECNYADKCAVCRTKYPCQTIRALGGRQEWHP